MSEAGASRAVRALPNPGRGAGYDRVPPHNLDAEVSVLGAMLLSRDAIAEVSELVGPEDFYRGANRTLFEAARDLYDRGEPVDPVTLADELERRGQLEGVGGAVAIADLLAQVPTAANASYYARIVAEQAMRRRLIDAGTQITRFGYDADAADEAVDNAEALVYQVSQRRYASEFTPMKELLTASFELIERLHESNSAVTGLATGFHDFDELTAGLQPSNLVILAARPAMGKCLAASTCIVDPVTGGRRSIAQAVEAGRRGEAVRVAALGRDFKLRATTPSAYHENGTRPVFRVRTGLGREVVATANHPFLTPAGWLPLARLRPGSTIASPRALPYFGSDALPPQQVALLARLVGDGDAQTVPEAVFRLPRQQVALFLERLFACTGCVDLTDAYTSITFTLSSARLAGDVAHLLLRFGIVARVRRLRPAHGGTEEVAWQVQASGTERVATSVAGRTGAPGRDVMGSPSRTSPTEPASALGGKVVTPEQAPDVCWDEVVSVEQAGEERVFDLTVPGDRNFVADDVVVHNSTLVTNVATNVAVELRKPVVMFSLEMSKMELVQRILAGEGRVDSERLRTGRLHETDWPKLSQAMGRLAEAPLFIDDTPGINLMEIRSKCRRLKQQHGLDLVIVDYLQLMQTHRRFENRVQEVSELSRGLKILAKELDVPVLALSQLSRRPEDRTDRRPQLSDLRESGCVAGDTLVTLASGARVPIRELAGGRPQVATLDGWRLAGQRAAKVWRTGRKPVWRVVTASGRAVRATANHPFFAPDGWRAVTDLGVGVRVGAARVGPPAVVDDDTAGRTLARHAQPQCLGSSRGLVEEAATLAVDGGGPTAVTDVYWDVVRSVRLDGVEDVYDMTVPATHNFVADGLIVHNSIEQDADLVAFIYRDEVYDQDSPAKGEAELIVAKHRNGPLRTIRLSFIGHHSRFASMARLPGPGGGSSHL